MGDAASARHSDEIQHDPALRQAAIDYAVLVKEYQSARHAKVKEK